MIYDTAIIGSGPAGLSAALNLKIRDKKFIWLGSNELSDKVRQAEKISNYPGLPEISGMELTSAFRSQMDTMDITITESMVTSIVSMGDHYALMAGSDFYEASTLILTTGVSFSGTLPGEQALMGKGVSYCATCDGMLYRGKTIAVISNDRRFEEEVKFLAGLAAKVYFFPLYKEPSSMPETVEVMDQRAVAVEGQDRVEALRLKNGDTIRIDGLFCLRNSISLHTLLPELQMEDGHIAVDRRMATNLPGVFAAGDCTGRPYQYTKAVGEGNVAAHSALEYLSDLNNH